MNKKTLLFIVVAFIAGGFFIGRADLSKMLPFVIILICPLMMLFMMGGHKHK